MPSWFRHQSLEQRAGTLLNDGRYALKQGRRPEAIALFHAAMQLDPTVACEDWGLLPCLEAEGRGIFRTRMLDRLQAWYHQDTNQTHRHVARLSHKMHMRSYMAGQGIPLPALLAEAPSIEALDWAALPQDRVVIKPQNAANNDGVVIAVDGIDRMTGEPLNPDLPTYARTLHARHFETLPAVLVEDCLRDIGADMDPDLHIPRDFKVFAVAGLAVFVRVHDRNAPNGKRDMATFDRKGQPRPAALKKWPVAPAAPPPAGFGALIEMAETLSRQLPWLLRFDFYLTPDGPVFGEMTSFPNAGLDCTPFGRRTLLQMWEIWPDENGSVSLG